MEKKYVETVGSPNSVTLSVSTKDVYTWDIKIYFGDGVDEIDTALTKIKYIDEQLKKTYRK